MPETPSPPRPVLIFVHGGAFVAGNKHDPGSPFYDNIMLWAVKNGFVGVNITYRLAPQAMWPAGAEDLASAVQWVSDKIAARGGDPARLYLMGHSAGAVHVASYVSHPDFQKVKGGGLAGAILVSGVYDLTVGEAGGPEKSYFGADPVHYAERSSLRGLGENENPADDYVSRTGPARFRDAIRPAEGSRLRGAQRLPARDHAAQHSHMSEVYSINTADTRLTDQILDFVKTGK